MTLSLASTTASALADKVTELVDAGAAAGTLSVYTGEKPDTGDDAPTGTLLATWALSDPSAAAAAAGVADWDTGAGIDTTVLADGVAGWFRIADSDGNPVTDGDVGDDLVFDSTVWATGETVTLGASQTIENLS